TLVAAHAHALLGGERTALVFDGHAGFDVEAFGACAGVVRGGGLCPLLAPPLAEWPARAEKDNARLADCPHLPAAESGRLRPRLVRVLREAGVPVLDARGDLPSFTPPPAAPPGPTPDQADAITAIRHTALGHAHRPLVLLAD